MTEVVGLVQFLIGIAFVIGAVLIPVRASNVRGGFIIAAMFAVGAVERFIFAYLRLSELDLESRTATTVSASGSVAFLVALAYVAYEAVRAPVKNEAPKK